jgi:hypothetical protein
MMRKLLLFALTSLPIFLFGQAQRNVLVEEFTNASCAPCAAQNPGFNELLNMNTTNVISIKYQWDFPGYDPFNEQNPTEVDVRATYYGLDGVPTIWIDGVLPGEDYAEGAGDWGPNAYDGAPAALTQGALDWATAQTTPLEITLTHSVSEDLTQVTIDVTVTNVSDQAFEPVDGRLHVALLERYVEFPEPPGSTDESVFEWIMRKMYPNAEGTTIASIAAGESFTQSFTEDIPAYIYDPREVQVVAFVEDHDAQEVFQAAITEPEMLTGVTDAALTANLTPVPGEGCGVTVTPSVTMENAGDVDITSATVDLLVNGSVVESQQYSGTLAPGAEETVSFSELAINGTLAVTFFISEVNGGEDIAFLNNYLPTEQYIGLSDTPIGMTLEEDNENYDLEYPATAVALPGIPLGSFGGQTWLVYNQNNFYATATGPIGGYGESENSIYINFYQWDPTDAGTVSDEATLTYQKIDLTGVVDEAVALSFDRACQGYSGFPANDRLQVLVSTDCAETFDVVWDQAGTNLYNAGAGEPLFVPGGGDWVTENIDLSAYIGQEVNVQFKAITDWGNNCWLDNINLTTVTSTRELLELTGFEMFPNPADEQMSVRFNLEETTQMEVSIYNALGQQVQVVATENFGTGRHTLDVNTADLSEGVYFLRLRNADRENSHRFIVSH